MIFCESLAHLLFYHAKRFGFLVGIFRKNGVKLTIYQVPFKKLKLVNSYDRHYKKMPKDARDYI